MKMKTTVAAAATEVAAVVLQVWIAMRYVV
jgi:hypothetical protein